MDEILTSIRRIISDDPSPAKPGRRVAPEISAQEELPAAAQPEASVGPVAANIDRGSPPLLSATPESETASSFASLNHTIFARNARTIDDVVQEMLRPMLQNWLDAHLPALVERLVRQEIERISGR